jgi:hypothetical protein
MELTKAVITVAFGALTGGLVGMLGILVVFVVDPPSYELVWLGGIGVVAVAAGIWAGDTLRSALRRAEAKKQQS